MERIRQRANGEILHFYRRRAEKFAGRKRTVAALCRRGGNGAGVIANKEEDLCVSPRQRMDSELQRELAP